MRRIGLTSHPDDGKPLIRGCRGWRQKDLGMAAGVSQQLVAVAELGQIERLTVRAVRTIGAALSIRLPFDPKWMGGEPTRLLDRDHATVVNTVVAILRRYMAGS